MACSEDLDCEAEYQNRLYLQSAATVTGNWLAVVTLAGELIESSEPVNGQRVKAIVAESKRQPQPAPGESELER